MVVTMNARSLMNFFQLRCCNRAQWEIRELAEKMFALVYPVAPHIFAKAGPACLCGPLPRGQDVLRQDRRGARKICRH